MERLLRSANSEPTGLQAGLVVLVVCGVITTIGWTILSYPPRIITGFVASMSLPVTNGKYVVHCGDLQAGTFGVQFCSATVALFTIAGPIAVMICLFLFRIPLAKWSRRMLSNLPEEAEFLVTPIIATLIFTMGWAGIHHPTPFRSGIVPHIFFPALVGLFAYVTIRYNEALQRRLAPIFETRDKVSMNLRLMFAILIPFILAIGINSEIRVSHPALNAQLVVLLAAVIAYLLLVSKEKYDGDGGSNS